MSASTVSVSILQPWLSKVLEKLPEDQKDDFKTKSQPALKFLIGMIKELQLCVLPLNPLSPSWMLDLPSLVHMQWTVERHVKTCREALRPLRPCPKHIHTRPPPCRSDAET